MRYRHYFISHNGIIDAPKSHHLHGKTQGETINTTDMVGFFYQRLAPLTRCANQRLYSPSL